MLLRARALPGTTHAHSEIWQPRNCAQGILVRYQQRQGRYRIKLDDGKEIDIALPHDSVKLLPEGGGGGGGGGGGVGGGSASTEQPKSGKKAKK